MADYDYTDQPDSMEQPPDRVAPQPDVQRLPAAEPPAEPPAPEQDPGLVELEMLRQRERGRRRTDGLETLLRPRAEPSPDQALLTRDLEESGWFARMQEVHRAERERAREDAIRESTERAERRRAPDGEDPNAYWQDAPWPGAEQSDFDLTDALREAPRWIAQQFRQVPGGVVQGGGSVAQAPDVVAAELELAEQQRRIRSLAIAGRIDRGEAWAAALRDRPGAVMDRRFLEFARTYATMTPEQREVERLRLIDEVSNFRPTPIAERELYRTGQWLQERGRNLVPHLEGYGEQSVATQLGRGLGSILFGMAGSPLGTLGRLTLFGGMGIGEATQRAVDFDRTEREAGRPGLSHEQIVLAGLMGIGPGSTDVAPVELLLGGLNTPGMTPPIRTALARFINSVGGRAFVQAATEGGQEGLQQFLQNLIAREVYNPGQSLWQDVPGSSALGAGVGAESSVLLDMLRGAAGRVRVRPRGGQTDTTQPPQTQPPPPTQEQPPATPPPGTQEQPPTVDMPPPGQDPTFGFSIPGGPVTPPATEEVPPAPETETPPADEAPESPWRIERRTDLRYDNRLARLTFTDLFQFLPRDANGDPDTEVVTRILQDQYGVDRWGDLPPSQRAALYLRLRMEARERERGPVELPPTPEGPEGVLRETVNRIIADRGSELTPEEEEAAVGFARRFAPSAEALADQALRTDDINRLVAENLPQWRETFETELRRVGINQQQIAALVDASVQVIGQQIQDRGITSLEDLARHAYQAGQRAAIDALERQGEAAGQAGQAGLGAPRLAGGPTAGPGAAAGARATAGAPRAEPSAAATAAAGSGFGAAPGTAAAARGPAATPSGRAGAGGRTAAQPGGTERAGATPATVGGERDRSATAPGTARTGGAERGAGFGTQGEPGGGGLTSRIASMAQRPTEQAAQPVTEPTPQQKSGFRQVLARPVPLKWAEVQRELGATPEQIEALQKDALANGLLRLDRNGIYRRTPAAKEGGPPVVLASFVPAPPLSAFPFSAPRQLAQWAGFPHNRFVADLVALSAKRPAKSVANERDLTTPELVKAAIEEVLEDGSFVFPHRFEGSTTLVKSLGDGTYLVVGIKPSDREHSVISTVYHDVNEKVPGRLAAEIAKKGVGGVKWKEDPAAIQALLDVLSQGTGARQSPQSGTLTRTLRKMQATLRLAASRQVPGSTAVSPAEPAARINDFERQLIIRSATIAFRYSMNAAIAEMQANGRSKGEIRSEVYSMRMEEFARMYTEERDLTVRQIAEILGMAPVSGEAYAQDAIKQGLIEKRGEGSWEARLDLPVSRMVELYKQGVSPKDIGAQFGVTSVTVRNRLKQAGVDTSGGRIAVAQAPNIVRLVEHMRGQGYSHRQIGVTLGLKREQVRDIARRHGTEARIDSAIRLREKQTGTRVSGDVRRIAIDMRRNLGTHGFARAFELAAGKRGALSLKAQDIRDLAALVGAQVKARMSKAEALKLIRARHIEQEKFLQRQAAEDNLTTTLASFVSDRDSAQSQRADLDALGFYSKALAQAKAWKQKSGTPQQAKEHLLKGGSGVKAELETIGIDKFLEGKKSVTRSELVSFLEQNRVEVREAVYPKKATHKQGPFETDEDYDNDPSTGAARWSTYSLDPSNPTYRETVLHLPSPADALEAETLRGRSIRNVPNNELEAVGRLRQADFRSGHFSEPNVIAHIRSSLQRDADGKATYLLENFQSDWGEAIRDGIRNAYARQMFGPESEAGKARIAELEKRVAKAKATQQSAFERTRMENQDQGKVWGALKKAKEATERLEAELSTAKQPKDWRSLTPEQKASASAAIAADRKAGTLKGGVRDEAKIAELEKRVKDLEKALALGVEARTTLLAHGSKERAVEWSRRNTAIMNVGVLEQLEAADTQKANAFALAVSELATAKEAAPGHPMVNTTEQWVTTGLRRIITQAVEAGADRIALTPGKVLVARGEGRQDDPSGMLHFQDTMLPLHLGKILQKMDPAIKAEQVELRSSVDGKTFKPRSVSIGDNAVHALRRHRGDADAAIAEIEDALRTTNPRDESRAAMEAAIEDLKKAKEPILFHSFPVTEKVNEQVRREGVALFAISSARSRLGPEGGQAAFQTGPYTRLFRERQAETVKALEAEFRRMLPATDALRLVDRLVAHGVPSREIVTAPGATMNEGFGFRWMLSVALAEGPATAKLKGFHGIAGHILRRNGKDGIYTDKEWQIFVERAEKVGIKKEMQKLRVVGSDMSLWEAYETAYAQYGPERQAEFLEQELVANLAEKWAAGTNYGTRVNTLFERLAKYLDAIRNWLRGLGFRTYDDLFKQVVSGEMAERAGGVWSQEIPTYNEKTYFPNTPTPSEAHLATEEAREALRSLLGPDANLPAFVADRDSTLTDDDVAIARLQLNDWFAENGLSFDLADQDVRDVAGILARGASVEQALDELAAVRADEAVGQETEEEAAAPPKTFGNFLRRLFGRGTTLPSFVSAPEPRAFGFDGGTVTEKVKETGERLRTYSVGLAESGDVATSEVAAIPVAKDGNRWKAESQYGSVSATFIPSDNAVVVAGSGLLRGAQKGQGHGLALYQALADEALRNGYVLRSNNGVSLEASRVYEALERRGYVVTKNPNTVFVGGKNVAEGGVFTVERGPPQAETAKPSTSLIVSEQPDGSWELTFFKAEPDQLANVRNMIPAIEADIGKRISPRGWLTPEGYSYWSQVAPDKVRFHQNAGELFGGMFASPRAVEFAEAVLAEAAGREADKAAMDAAAERFPRAGAIVDGRMVREDVPNLGSISATLENYDTLPGIREVPRSAFHPEYQPVRNQRVRDLAADIAESGELNPLIVGLDKEGAWIIEGGHRFDALMLSGFQSLPAVVAVDLDSPPTTAITSTRSSEASSHLSRLKSSLPPEAFQEARGEERFSFASVPPLQGQIIAPLYEQGTIGRIGRGEIPPPSADELTQAAANVRTRELDDLVRSFGGDRAKAERFQRLFREAERATGERADALDAEREALAQEAVEAVETVYEDAFVLDALARTFKDMEEHPDEIADIVQRHLADLPVPGQYVDAGGEAALAVMRKAAAVIEANGLDSRAISGRIIAAYRARFSDPQDAEFMVDALRAALAPQPRQLPGQTLASFAPQAPLDMSPEARKARAEAMGFDTSKVWYHGTTRNFGAFDPARRGENTSAPSAEVGFFFTDRRASANYYSQGFESNIKNAAGVSASARRHAERMARHYEQAGDPEEASAWKQMAQESGGPNVMPVYLRVRNPLVHDFKGRVSREVTYRNLIDQAIKEGRDGVILRNTYDAGEYSRFDAMMRGRFRSENIVVVFSPTNIRSVNAAFDPREESSPVLLASFNSGPPNAPRPLAEIISDLKSALGMTTTQGLYGMQVRDRAGNRTWRFRVPDFARGQYDRNAGVARIRVSTDIEAIAHEGGHHLERVFGQALETFKTQHSEELGVPPVPDTPLPAINPTGFSGIELDADTQRVLVDAANSMRVWRQMMAPGTRKSDNSLLHQAAADAATAIRTLERRLGRTVANALAADLVGNVNLPNGGILGQTPYRLNVDMFGNQVTGAPIVVGGQVRPQTMIDPARLQEYVRERYSATGTPQPRVAPTPTPQEVSEGFAEFFRQYITAPDVVKREMPGVFTAFEDFLDANDPAMLEALEKVQLFTLSRDYRDYRQATALQRLKADTISNADQRLVTRLKDWYRSIRRDSSERRERSTHQDASAIGRIRSNIANSTVAAGASDMAEGVTSFASVVYETAIDETHPIYLLTRKLLEQADINKVVDAEGRALSLAVHENPAKLIRSVADAYKTGLRWIQDGMPSYRHGGAGFEVHAGSRLLGLRTTMAEAQQLAATATGSTQIVPVAGRRSDPLRLALELSMGKNWNYDTYENLGTYLIARRAVEEWARHERGELERRPIKSYSTGQPADEIATLTNIIREYDTANPNFRQAAEVVYNFLWAQSVHDFQSGRISQAKLDYRATRKHFYVPYSRDMRDMLSQRGFGGRRSSGPVKDTTFIGSDRAIMNPIETIIDQTFHQAAETHLNEVVGAIAKLTDKSGPGSAAIAERVTKTEIVRANNDAFAALEKRLQDMGYDAQDAERMVRRVAADFGDTHLLVSYDPTHLGPKRPILLTLYENGERQYIRVNDPEWAQHIYNSLNGIGRELTNLWIDMVAAPSALLRFGVTTHWAFIGPNIIRDMWSAFILTGSVLNPRSWPVVTQARGLYHELRQTDMARFYQEAAGLMGGQNVAALSKVRDKADVMALQEKGLQIRPVSLAVGTAAGATAGFFLGGPWGILPGAIAGASLHRGIGKGRFTETLSYFADMSETATRLGVFTEAYKAALKWNPNLTPYQAAQEAAFVSRDLIDFGRRGSKMLTAARLVTFMNANLQGLDKATRQLLGRSDRGMAFSTTKLTGLMATSAAVGTAIGGPVGGAVATFAVPALATNLAARSAAVRALLAPFTRKDMGIPISQDEERALGQSAKAWSNLLLYTLTLVAAGALYHGYNGDDDEYNRIDPRFRFRNQPMKILGEWFMFPKAFEWAVPSNIIEAAIESQFYNDPRFWERVREGLFDVLAPPGIPQAIRLHGDISSNFDRFRQRPIVGERARFLDPELQFNAFASQFAIAVARAVNRNPMARGAVESVGGVVFGSHFELSPAVIDYVLRSGLGYWGADVQRLSNVVTVGSNRITDVPLLGAAARRFMFDPNRISDAMHEYWRLMGAEHVGFRRAAQSYRAHSEMYGARGANEYLARLESPEQQAYALLESSGYPEQKRRHPLNRLRGIVSATMDIERELALERFTNTSSPTRPAPIVLSPAKRDEVRDALARIRAIEANNAMVLLGHRQFAGRGLIDVAPALAMLRAASEDAFAEYERRAQRQNVVPFADVQNWPQARDRLLTDWREAMDREAALIRRSGRGRRRPERMPIGGSREDLQPQQ